MLARLREKLAETGAWADGLASRAAWAAKSWLIWPFALAIAIGSGLWANLNVDKLSTLDANKLDEPSRVRMLVWVGAAFAALVLVYAIVTVARRVASGAWHVVDSVVRTSRLLSPLLALPLVAALRLAAVERDSPKATLFLIALAALCAARFGYELPVRDGDAREPTRGQIRAAKIASGLLVAAIFVGYAWFFSRVAIINHHALNTRTTDLGYYDNIFWNSAHGHPLACSFIKAGYHGSAHFDPILVLLSPLYRLYPHAETLLILQSVWLGSGAIPVYLVARDKLASRPAAVALAALWAIYPAMHGMNLYEFHSLTLISPLVVWLLWAFERSHVVAYWSFLALLLLCREDVPLLLCFVGLYQLLVGRKGAARTGLLTIFVSVLYFVVVKAFFMTSSGVFMTGKDAYSFAYYYEALIPNKTGINGLVLSLLTNPVFAVKTMFDEPKVLFFVTIFLPLAFLPFFAKTGRIMLVYGLAFCLLASRGAVFSIHFQYSSVLFPIAFVLTPMALRDIESGPFAPWAGLDPRRWTRALLFAAMAAAVLVSWKLGGIVDNASFKGGFVRVAHQLTDENRATMAWIKAQASAIPTAASVGTTNRVGAHVSNRRWAFFYPEKQNVDWLFLDEAELKPPDLERLQKEVQAGKWSEVSRRGKIAVYKRKT